MIIECDAVGQEGVHPQNGINGQGPNEKPLSHLNFHALVQVGATVYDPSYGNVYVRNELEESFRTKSLQGFYIKRNQEFWATDSISSTLFPLYVDENPIQ